MKAKTTKENNMFVYHIMLVIKQPLPPTNFMTKGKTGIAVSGFMGKHPGIIRGVTLQPHHGMISPVAVPRNTLER